ncbi:hypothetical protein BDB00DRAFT_953320 [Zychaea mexicana]|uniref:uncharacterized protein n=1 Tax=Zychaea mexicana TaxID=64656 RepID=UPI0022FECD99|nr:uncharacterized protein BDB00DRAFT_953320 [Zychaea mexicana]KAI9496343.1 hypothetical protein BDB00DRAFT_953320 [Zychaea mexicana]
MASYGLPEFGSPLDSLVFDTIAETEQSEHDAAEELALWSNAQFTFDVNPGKQAGPEDDKIENSNNDNNENSTIVKEECPSDVLDPITYEKLVEYLDYELPQQQQAHQQSEQQQQQRSSQYAPIAPITPQPHPQPIQPATLNGYVPIYPATTRTHPRRPTILPKPVALDSLPLAAAAASPIVQHQHEAVASQPKPARKKKRAVSDERTDDQVAAEEDKRRRNTAASARFRVKKKLREQAMEKNVQDMKSKSDRLQNRVNELELEVKWLRNLLIEKRENA